MHHNNRTVAVVICVCCWMLDVGCWMLDVWMLELLLLLLCCCCYWIYIGAFCLVLLLEWHGMVSVENSPGIPYERKDRNRKVYSLIPRGKNDGFHRAKTANQLLGGGFKHFFIFTPTWGRFPFLTNICQMGLKPPTRLNVFTVMYMGLVFIRGRFWMLMEQKQKKKLFFRI